jgi:hypothetical protein
MPSQEINFVKNVGMNLVDVTGIEPVTPARKLGETVGKKNPSRCLGCA